MNKVITVGLLAALAMTVAVVGLSTSTANAELTCETKSGNAPPGQQGQQLKDSCGGSKVVVTPSGNEPPGQNP
jgi:hypothetical protein